MDSNPEDHGWTPVDPGWVHLNAVRFKCLRSEFLNFFVFLSKLEIHALSLTSISKETEISLFSRWRYRMKITVTFAVFGSFQHQITPRLGGFHARLPKLCSDFVVQRSNGRHSSHREIPSRNFWNFLSKKKKKKKENVLYFRRTCRGFENERPMRVSWVETIMVSGQSWELTSFKCSIKLITFSLPFFFQRRLSFSTDAFKQ